MISQRLKEACALTQVSWAAWVSRANGQWQSGESVHLTKPRLAELLKMLAEKSSDSLLSGALAAGRVRSRTLEHERLACKKLFAFPASGSSLVLVGVEKDLSAHEQRIWKLAACYEESAPPNHSQSAVLELQQTQQELQARISAQMEAEARLIQAAKLAAVAVPEPLDEPEANAAVR